MQNNNLSVIILLACGILSPVIFVVSCIIIGQILPNYSSYSNFISFMTLGDLGWLERLNEIICSFLLLLCAVGLRLNNNKISLAVLAVAVFGMLAALLPTSYELLPGVPHRVAVFLLFAAMLWLIIASISHIKGRAWNYFTGSMTFIITLTILSSIIFNPGFKGVLQRIAIFGFQIWLLCLITYFFKKHLKATLVKV